MEDRVIDLYNQGFRARQIAKILNITQKQSYEILQKIGLSKKCYKKTEEIWNNIYRLYESGVTIKELSKKFHSAESTISSKLKSKGYRIRTTNGYLPFSKELSEDYLNSYFEIYKNIKINYTDNSSTVRKTQAILNNPFSDLTKDSVHYWLGYMAADGCVHTKSNRIDIVSCKDPTHLENYCKFLNHKVSIQKHKDNRKEDYWNYCVSFCNKEVKNYLIELGLTPNKSKTIKMNIPLSFAFLRGVFDGDGCVSKSSKNSISWGITTASKEFAIQINNFLRENYIVSSITGDSQYLVRVGGKENLSRLYKYLYYRSEYFLQRKQEEFYKGLKGCLNQ